MLYTRKINWIFSDIQNRIFNFEVAARDMMNFEWSYIFPRSRINLPFVVSFNFLGDIVETKLIREATPAHCKEFQFSDMGWYCLGLNSIYGASNAFDVYTCPV